MQEVGKFFFKNGATYEGEYVLAGGPPRLAPTPEPSKKGVLLLLLPLLLLWLFGPGGVCARNSR
jgi:hypothetical protein